MNTVERVERAVKVGLSCIAPSGKERRRHIADARRVAARQVSARRRKLSLLDIVNGDCEPREVVARIAHKEPFAERAGARFVAIRESRREGALEEIGISRVSSEGFPVVDFSRRRVPISAGDKSRKIISGLRIPNLQLLRSRFGLHRRSQGANAGY